ncbi:ATP-binding cassette domain-containing protein [Sphingobium subterraneum]|uniref:ATP-binding cassette subfamily C protein LapB n=1 Tax=Sphingobium subterraneum TaxID=627688 RepID=A0A841J0I3_9SPHN|nr:ATP-binding cassette domain-containing protein [Sphingobium subterraneum]MBB6123036.1 ATP-binding cassette subfamily C protein LapB [Sphingobium subterraneum]
MTDFDMATRTSLLGRLVGGLRGKRAPADPQWHGVIDPLSVVGALELLATRCGRPTPRDRLTAALPVADGDLDPRLTPIAMARAGFEARWDKVRLSELSMQDVPLLAPMLDGGAVLIVRIESQDIFVVVDATGEKQIPRDALAPMLGEEMLMCGHVDPENGLGYEEERSFVRRNPRLWLIGTFLSERRRLTQLLVAAAFLNLCALAIPLYMRAIYDRVVPNLATESLWALSVGVMIVLSFEFMFKHVRGSYIDAVGVRVGQAVQHRAMTSFLHARTGKRDNNVGTLMTALRDVEGLALLVPQMIVTFIVDVPFFFAYLALIMMIGGWTVMGPVLGACGMMFVGAVASYATKLSSKRAAKLMQARNNLVVDVAEGLTTIKANQAEGRFMRQWDIVSDHIGMSTKTARKWNELPGSMSGLLVQMVTVMVIIIGVYQIKAGIMTTGAMIAVTMLTGRAMVPVSTAISMVSKGYQSLSQFAGLANLLSMEAERDVSDPSIQRSAIKGEMKLAHIDFTYEQASEASLRDVGITITPGEKIALIGRSGSGKSTLLQILAGILEPSAGTISLDGHALEQYASAHLRKDIVYCGQDAALFDTSIWDNILLGMNEPDPALVERAIAASGLDRFVSRSAEGYGRKIGQHGRKLSGGQRQSLVLARALIRDPKILLLDEPTASMDINSEQAVITGLREATKGCTLIVATHRMALLDLVDRIIWLDDGKVVADRPRTEILTMLRNQQNGAAKAA